MICQCEICGKFPDKAYDASELAIIFHVSQRDNSMNDPNKFIICENCYNAIERAVATAWLSQIDDGEKGRKERWDVMKTKYALTT